jgi:DNA-binding Lrp family transcriptional regulator
MYIAESKSGNITSCFVPMRVRHSSESGKILEILRRNGGMTPEAVAKTLEIELTRSRQLLSKLKAKGLIKKKGIYYELE